MATTPTLPKNATKAQALAYLAQHYANKYHNATKTPYEGMDAAQIYAYIEKRHPKAKPYDIAVATADLLVSSAFAQTLQGGVTAAGQDLGAVAKGTATANYAPWSQGLGTLLGDLTSSSLWFRVLKILGGGALVAIGLVMLVESNKSVQSATATVAKAAI